MCGGGARECVGDGEGYTAAPWEVASLPYRPSGRPPPGPSDPAASVAALVALGAVALAGLLVTIRLRAQQRRASAALLSTTATRSNEYPDLYPEPSESPGSQSGCYPHPDENARAHAGLEMESAISSESEAEGPRRSGAKE